MRKMTKDRLIAGGILTFFVAVGVSSSCEDNSDKEKVTKTVITTTTTTTTTSSTTTIPSTTTTTRIPTVEDCFPPSPIFKGVPREKYLEIRNVYAGHSDKFLRKCVDVVETKMNEYAPITTTTSTTTTTTSPPTTTKPRAVWKIDEWNADDYFCDIESNRTNFICATFKNSSGYDCFGLGEASPTNNIRFCQFVDNNGKVINTPAGDDETIWACKLSASPAELVCTVNPKKIIVR